MATINGTAGNDTYNGTNNTDDTAVINSTSSQIEFSLDAQGRWVVIGPAGIDTLNSIEKVQLNDGAISLSILGSETRVSANKQYDSKVTQLANGDIVIVWTSGESNPGQDGSGSGVYMQRYSSAGIKLGGEVRVNEFTHMGQRQASVTALPDGNYVVVWSGPYASTYPNPTTDLYGDGIFMQMYDGSGNKIGSERVIADNRDYNSFLRNPTVTTLEDGSFIVAHESGMSSVAINQYRLTSMKFDSTGAYINSNSTDRIGWDNSQNIEFGWTDDSVVTALSDGGYILSWQGRGQYESSSSYGLYFQRYDSSNAKVGGIVKLDDATSLQRYANSASLPDGGFVIIWQGTSTVQDNAHDLQGNGVYMQYFDSTGAKVGGKILVNSTTSGHQYAGEVTTLDSGNIVVTWTSEGQDGSGYGVYFQMFDYIGIPVGKETLVNTSTSGAQRNPAITSLSDGGFLITWQSENQVTSLDGIYMQRFDANGVALITTLEGNANANTLEFTSPLSIKLLGEGGNDILASANGDDVLDGGSGNDTMAGGTGNDTYVVDSTQDQVNEAASSGTDTIQSSVTYVLADHVENLTLTGVAAINGTGNSANNVIAGNSAANVLNGGAGADTMTGGGGDDVYYVDNAGDKVTETDTALVTGGSDTVVASVTYQLGANVENLRLNSSNAINAKGNALDNVIFAGAGSNVLDGSTGIDTVSYQFATAGIAANLSITTSQNTLGSGNDTLIGFEYLVGSNYNDSLTGDAGDNLIMGAAGNDSIQGGSGGDAMIGGLGNDTYYVDNVRDFVVEVAGEGFDRVNTTLADYTLGAEIENGRIVATGAANITGNALNNLLHSGAGNNILKGEGGSDTVSYGDAKAAVNVSLAITSTQATGGSGTDTLVSIENLTGSNYNDKLTGNSLANVLDGGVGADTLAGGLGNDTYYVDNAGDTVVEAAGGGTDLVYSTLAAYMLGAEVENGRISASGTANLSGNALSNTLYAGAGNNVIKGEGGTDTVSYAYATAAVKVSLATAAAQATGGSGSDTLVSIENLNGSNYNDTLTGNSSANLINGGTGADRMTGGDGNDIYYVDNAGDVVVETNASAAGGIDEIRTTRSLTLGANIENVLLLSVTSSATGNVLANKMTGSIGTNYLNGGAGNDTLTGGGGADFFSFSTALNITTNVDRITDFAADDTIRLDNAVFTKLALGALNANHFKVLGTSARDADDYILYDKATGALYYDADGWGGNQGVKFAVIGVNLNLSSADFLIY